MAGEYPVVSRGIDPITFEVIQNGLGSIVDEMALTVMRTAYSGIVKDALDYSTAFCDRRGEMIAQGLTIVVHLGSFPVAVQHILTQYAGRIFDGDVFILNDPYGSGGIHLPDIYVIAPVFVDGELEGFSCALAHHTDVGGIVPGSNSTAATEIYQEGLRIPTLKLYERGVPNEAIFAILEKNVRVPVKVLGDLRAELAAVAIGERAYRQLAKRYGAQVLREYTDELLDVSERLAREEIRGLPDGTFSFTSHIDGDSIDTGPVLFQVAVTISEDRVVVDFSGSSPQVRAGINSPLPFSRSAVYGALRLIMDPSIPNSAGYFRAIEIRAPEGSVVNPRLPAACGARGITGFRIMDTVLGALAQAVPDRVPADGEGGNTILSMGGYGPLGEPWVYVDLVAGARGGGPRADGCEGVPHPASNIANTPVEVLEAETPVRIESYELLTDSEGAGQFRGALGQVREVRCLAPDSVLQIRSDKRRFPPYPLFGGQPGSPSWNILNPGPDQVILPTLTMTQIRQNDLLRHVMAGGAGWGDPFERAPELVQADVWNEKITIGRARDTYGVVIHPATLQLDWAATEELRAINGHNIVHLIAEKSEPL
jgi:N-methylhydantoinase B